MAKTYLSLQDVEYVRYEAIVGIPETLSRMHCIQMELNHDGAMIADLRGDEEACIFLIRCYGHYYDHMDQYEREYERGLLTDLEWWELQLHVALVNAARIVMGY